MRWRLFLYVPLLGLICLLEGFHIAHHAPRSFDDPSFFDKMMVVACALVAAIIAHVTRGVENKKTPHHQ